MVKTATYIICLADGQRIALEDATMEQVASAISIIKIIPSESPKTHP